MMVSIQGILGPNDSDEHFGLLMAGEELDKVVN